VKAKADSTSSPFDKPSRIFTILPEVSEIPPLPSVTTRILELAEDPTSSAQDLTAIISHDPSLTAQILKAANSAFYGFPNKIGTVYLAIVILGFNMVRTISLSAGVLKIFKTKGPKASLLNPNLFWEHSLKSGVACKLLASRYKYYLNGEAFTAGILHDVGRIVLAHYATARYNEVIKRSVQKKCSLLEAEQTLLQFTHSDVGGYLLRAWNLPISIVDAVTFHHEPKQSPNSPDLASITCLADYLSHLHSFREGREKEEPELTPTHWGILSRPENEKETVEDLLDLLNVELRKAAGFLEALQQ
jgi:HD-like signal output (HDOD) protein